MEADWAVEIGADLPRIDASWEGFVDLRASLDAVDAITEVGSLPALRAALVALNAENSTVFTAKCDVWTLAGEEIDPDEFGVADEKTQAGFASYLDIVMRAKFESFPLHEQWARCLVDALRTRKISNGRVDVVVRAAVLNAQEGFGLTLYTAGCGHAMASALSAWKVVLEAAVAATIATAAFPSPMGE